MPISVIIGGQFGSEGKGKVSAKLASAMRAAAVVRVGGPNSGHTAYDEKGRAFTLRQIPAGIVNSKAVAVIAAGSLVQPTLLLEEAERLGLDGERLVIDPKATIVRPQHADAEKISGLVDRIGSTASGTGAALVERLQRPHDHVRAGDVRELQPYLHDSAAYLRRKLDDSQRIIVEGTQGFGLSVWHSPAYPFTTSRDTTAAAFVAEAGLAPHDVDDVVMVMRSFPIRVSGNSGPLPNEISWPELAAEAALPEGYDEKTSVTHKTRRLGRFDPDIVRAAMTANSPHRIVLNHMDYIDPAGAAGRLTDKSRSFIRMVERGIGRNVDLLGFGPDSLIRASEALLDECA
jgi:adenylosuccinate synthase